MSFSGDIYYDEYHRENLPLVMNLIENDLSEPYSIFTYHYFLEDHPHLCLTAWECDGEILKSHEKDLNDGKKVHFYPDFDINIHPKSNIQLKPITGEASNSVSNFSEDKENIIKGQDFRKRRLVGVIIGKTGVHGKVAELSCMRGYIGMLAVSEDFRGRGIALMLIRKMLTGKDNVQEIVLETEVSNTAALKLYARLGFVREKRLSNYYLNGSDAMRLKLWV